MPKPTNFNTDESLEVIWDALHAYREDLIPEGEENFDDQWSDICTEMAWISEALEANHD